MKSGTSKCRHFVSLFIIAIWCQTGLFAGLEFAAERGVSKSQRDNRLERVVKEYEFPSWKGRTREKYVRPLQALDISTISIPTGKIEIVILNEHLSRGSRIDVLTKDGEKNLVMAFAHVAPDIESAQKWMLESFAYSTVRASGITLCEMGDRGYEASFKDEGFITFVRNNVHVHVRCWGGYSSRAIARQIDELILKQSRTPEKKWWHFFSR